MLLRKYAYALLLLFLIPLGCENGNTTAEQGKTTPTPSISAVQETPQPTQGSTTPADQSPDQSSPSPSIDQGQGSDQPAGMPQDDSIDGKVSALRLSSADSGWIGGMGWIARSDDGGKTWHKQYNGNETILQIFALNDQTAWAVTEQSNLLETTDGGVHWTKTGKVPNDGFLHFVSKDEGFIGNAMTKDGGKSWSLLPVPKQTVGAAYFHDHVNGWVVIQNNGMGIVERTTDGGKSWENVMDRKLAENLNGALIRSAGADDAWVEWVGGSGMTQTSYSLFHTENGGETWQTVLANTTAGGGPAPGFPLEYNDGPKNTGSKPGPLYVVDIKAAFMGGECPACDNPNTVGGTTDGGKTWVNGKESYPGYGGALLAFADAKQGWWICTDNTAPSVLYLTSDGGAHWSKVHTF